MTSTRLDTRPHAGRSRPIVAGVAVLALGVVAALAGCDSADETTSSAGGTTTQAATTTTTGTPTDTASATSAAPSPSGGDIGKTLTDGSFDFVVTEVETGLAELGDRQAKKAADGQFVAAQLEVTNNGAAPKYLSLAAQVAIDSAGAEHKAEITAFLYDTRATAFTKPIAVGATTTGVIFFDVPKDADVVEIELHERLGSAGIKAAV